MLIAYDAAKRQATLTERGLDFDSAASVFGGLTLDRADTRKEYGEPRYVTFGHLDERLVAIVWTPTVVGRRIFQCERPMTVSKLVSDAILDPEDDAPELTDEWLAGATVHENAVAISRGGRPRKLDPKRPVSLRLSADVLDYFRSTGRGWQTRINETLRDAIGKR